MGRSRRSAKDAGTSFETAITRYLSDRLGHEVKRMPKCGGKDRGDIDDVIVHGKPLAIECKNPGRGTVFLLPQWWSETCVEAENNGSGLGVLVIRRFGTSDVGRSFAVTSFDMWKQLSDVEPELCEKILPQKQWPSTGVVCFPRVKCRHQQNMWWVVCPLKEFIQYVPVEHAHSTTG